MDDNGSKGGLLALVIAVPAMVACCVGGAALFAGAAGAIGGWFTGTGVVTTLLLGLAATLFVRAWQKNRKHNLHATEELEE